MVTSLPRGVGLVGWYYIGVHLLLVWATFLRAPRSIGW